MNCSGCGDTLKYSGRGRPIKYCDTCKYNIKIQRNRKAMRKHRRNPLTLKDQCPGTTDFKPHMKRKKNGNPDFVAEAKDIKRELNLIRKQISHSGIVIRPPIKDILNKNQSIDTLVDWVWEMDDNGKWQKVKIKKEDNDAIT